MAAASVLLTRITAASLLVPAVLQGQRAAAGRSSPISLGGVRVEAPGAVGEDSTRRAAVAAGKPSPRRLLRSASAADDRDAAAGEGIRVRPLFPELLVVHNDSLPLALNTGSLWAGAGTGALIRVGARLDWGRLHVVLAPEIVREENRPFALPGAAGTATLDAAGSTRPTSASPYANPWYAPGQGRTIDAPLRFGADPRSLFYMGQTALWVNVLGADVGAGTEHHWWGPGVRNALVLSANAPGFPHLFVRPTKPIDTPIGTLDVRWLRGALVESRYFDLDPLDDLRAYGALGLTWAPRPLPHLTVGIASATYARVGSWGMIAGDFAEDLSNVLLLGVGKRRPRSERDGVWSLFGRWAFPATRAEAWGELARVRVREQGTVLTAPARASAWTLGAQWAGLSVGPRALRLQGEVTDLAQGRGAAREPWYTSAVVPQGYTHRGRVLGAAIGPGARSAWLAADLVGGRVDAGVTWTRIAWNDDLRASCAAAVTSAVGVRGEARTRGGIVRVAVQPRRRMRAAGSPAVGCGGGRTLRERALELSFAPRW